jgi:hypothetical protein
MVHEMNLLELPDRVDHLKRQQSRYPQTAWRKADAIAAHGKSGSFIGSECHYALVLLSRHGDAGTVPEDDLPDACLFLQEGRFQKPLCRLFLVTQLPRLTCSAGTSTETHSVETPTLEKYFPGHGILIFAEAHSHSRKRACLARYVS